MKTKNKTMTNFFGINIETGDTFLVTNVRTEEEARKRLSKHWNCSIEDLDCEIHDISKAEIISRNKRLKYKFLFLCKSDKNSNKLTLNYRANSLEEATEKANNHWYIKNGSFSIVKHYQYDNK